MIKNISFKEFLEILRKWSKKIAEDTRIKEFEINERGIEDAKRWFEIVKEDDNILIALEKEKDKFGFVWCVIEDFWNGGKQLSIEILFGNDKNLLKKVLERTIEFGGKKNVKIIKTNYITLKDRILEETLEELGFKKTFLDYMKIE